jgi:Holliday junction resolvase RusA-like endonuclease
MVKEVYEHNLQDVFVVPFYIDWLLDNKDNTLPFTSSGSFLTALTDIDNFMAAVVNLIDRELTDDDAQTAEVIFLEKMAK